MKSLAPILLVLFISPIHEPIKKPADKFPFPVSARKAIEIPKQYRAIVEREAQAVGIPVDILARVLHAESDYNPIATYCNRNGTIDSGIAQLNSKYMDYFSWKFNEGKEVDPYNPNEAIRIAAKILAFNYKVTNNWKEAVASYNAGLTRAKKKPWPVKTMEYVNSIFL